MVEPVGEEATVTSAIVIGQVKDWTVKLNWSNKLEVPLARTEVAGW